MSRRASSVYCLFGQPDAFLFVAPRSYHLRIGDHDLVTYDWQRYVDAAERLTPHAP